MTSNTLITIRVPGCPVAQPRTKATVRGGHAAVYTPSTIGTGPDRKPHPIVAFKATLRLAAERAYQGAPLSGPLMLSALFVFPRPASKVWKKRPMPREDHISAPDMDNLVKAVKDALKGIVWRDDCQVSRYSNITKVIAAGDEQPHCLIMIAEYHQQAAVQSLVPMEAGR